jgi:hypothetical protein
VRCYGGGIDPLLLMSVLMVVGSVVGLLGIGRMAWLLWLGSERVAGGFLSHQVLGTNEDQTH